ncbi:MAG: hypothetical protein D4R97_09135 [Bacteroidetes bacterium]|nr:MAG: hypothetical protein D4R97_09135 [Bacteroidota bacterium]
MKVIRILILLLLSNITLNIHAQLVDPKQVVNYTQTIPPPPTSASLGRYGESPVSYFTGRPEISVPLYTIEDYGYALPISLSYYASGIKVTDMASWVGIGWSLNAGGVITRTIRGMQDEINYNGFLSNAGQIIQSNLVKGNCPGCPNSSTDYLDLWDINNGNMDGLADIYYFNFGSYSGKFVFDYYGDIFQMPDNPLLKIIPYRDALPTDLGAFRHIHAFDIITEDGARYKFGDNATEKTMWESNYVYESSVYQFTQDNYPSTLIEHNLAPRNLQEPYLPYNNSWYLNKIILPNATDSILFTYETDSISYRQNWTDTYFYDSPKLVPDPLNAIYWPQILRNFSEYGVFTKRLSGISWKDGTISFIKNNDPREDIDSYYGNKKTNSYALSKIEIKNIKNQIVRRIDLKTSYFNEAELYSGTEETGKVYYYRLKLDTVIVNNQQYSFEYNPTRLPARYSPLFDFWGYYKHDSLYQTSSDLIHKISKPQLFVYPVDTSNSIYSGIYSIYPRSTHNGDEFVLPGKNMYPDLESTKAHVLTKITFPTGGSDSFEYELNSFLIDGQEQKAGGLRIKSITSFDGIMHDNDIKKEFLYNLSGKIANIPDVAKLNIKMVAFVHFPIWVLQTTPPYLEKLEEWKYATTIHSTSQAQLIDTKSNSVGYTEVTETNKNNSGVTINGKSVYKYSFPGALNSDCDYNINCLPSHPDSCRKAHKNIIITSQLLQLYSSPIYYPIHRIDNFPFLSNPDISFCKGLLLEEDNFDNLNQWVKKTTYDYCYGNQHPVLGIKSQFACNIEGVYEVIHCDANESCYAIFSAPFYFSDTRWGVDQILCGSVHLNKKTVLDYSSVNPSLFVTRETNYQYNNFLQLSSSSTLNSDGHSIITRFKYPEDYGSGNGDPYANAILTMKFNNKLNEVIETTRSDIVNNNEKVTTGELKFFNTTNSGNKVYLDKIDQIETNTAISNFSPSSIHSTFNFDSHYKDHIKFDEYNFNSDLTLRQVHKVDDINTSCYWGYRNAYKVVVAQNVTYSDLSSAIYSVNNNLEGFLLSLDDMTTQNQRNQWKQFNISLRSNADLAHSLVTTYTYKPLVGITSVTDPAGIATYYEYDAYGRLIFEKDNNFNIVKKYDYHYAGQ